MIKLQKGKCPEFLKREIKNQVALSLKEDDTSNDVSICAVAKNAIASAQVISRDPGILAGKFWFDEVFSQIDSTIEIHWRLHDGDAIEKNVPLCTLRGNARNLLRGERCSLNFLQTLSGTATTTATFAKRANNDIAIKDTRKTLPGLRLAQKYAVVCGGGVNHRMGLSDAILLKDNHIHACGSIESAVSATRCANLELAVEIEVTSLQQVKEALMADVDTIMLDNFDIDQITLAIKTIAGKAKIEISGGINLDDIDHLTNLGIDCISIGALTKHLHSLDLSMKFNPL